MNIFFNEALAHVDAIPHEEVDDVAAVDPLMVGGGVIAVIVIGFIIRKLLLSKK